MIFCGLDLSLTGSGIVVIDQDYNILHKGKLHVDAYKAERLYLLEGLLLKVLEEYPKVDMACIESPAYNDKGKLFEIGEWNGVVKLHLFKRSIPYIVAAPTQLKKYVLGSGDAEATKDLIILDVFKKFGEEIRENNIADAYVLSRIAHDYMIPDDDLVFYQKEVLTKIKANKKAETKGKVLI